MDSCDDATPRPTARLTILNGGGSGAVGAPTFASTFRVHDPLRPMPNTSLLRTAMCSNASACSSLLSSSSSTAADVVDPAKTWVALMEPRTAVNNTESQQGADTVADVDTSNWIEGAGCETDDAVRRIADNKKRGAGGLNGNQDDGEEISNEKTKPKRKRKYRKATHTIRKEEKEQLLKEMEALKTKIAELRNRTRTPLDEEKESVMEKRETARVLREEVQQRQQIFSELSSIMSEYTLCSIQSGSPLQDVIYLKNDEQSRRDTLEALKPRKLEKALHFMNIRRPKLDPCNTTGEERRYETENGEFCSTRFTVTQFEEAQSVKQVFDLLLFYFCNIEISVSEKIGHITIREDDGGDDNGIVQNRLVSTTHKNVKMESNTVMFSQFYDGTLDKRTGPSDSGYGLIVADFVDKDERHPYLPDQRVRRDVNAVLEIREFVPQHPKSVAGASPSRKPVVVLSRWVQNRMHYPSFPVCTEGWYELRNNMDLWGRALHRTIAENLRPRP